MLNGPTAAAADSYGPSVMPFIGLEAAAYKQQLWDWDTVAATTAAQHHQLPTASSAAFTTNTSTYGTQQQTLYTDSSCTLVDCRVSPSGGGGVSGSTSPSPFPQQAAAVSASFPFYHQATTAATVVPDYTQTGGFLSTSAIKAEDLDGVGCADGVVTGAGRIGLNLGHRTYFSSGDAGAIDGMLRGSRGFYGHQYYGYGHYQHQVPSCQAEGCKADLSGAKHYHRRHKVCEFHSKAAVVVAGAVQQRFCQQCSRFHVLGEFDETKRSCRKRLAEHNRRRRKPTTLPQQQQPNSNASGSAVSSPGTTATADASSSPAGSTTDTKTNHVSHNGGMNGPPISPNAAPTTVCMAATASTDFVTFSDDGKSPRSEAQLRASVTGLSLGGMDGNGRGTVTVAATDFDSDDAFHDHSVFLFGSEEKNAHQYDDHFQHQKQQQQHQLFSSSSSSNTFAHHNFFSNDVASQSTAGGGFGGGGSDQSVPRSNSTSLLNLGQSFFDVDFME